MKYSNWNSNCVVRTISFPLPPPFSVYIGEVDIGSELRKRLFERSVVEEGKKGEGRGAMFVFFLAACMKLPSRLLMRIRYMREQLSPAHV